MITFDSNFWNKNSTNPSFAKIKGYQKNTQVLNKLTKNSKTSIKSNFKTLPEIINASEIQALIDELNKEINERNNKYFKLATKSSTISNLDKTKYGNGKVITKNDFINVINRMMNIFNYSGEINLSNSILKSFNNQNQNYFIVLLSPTTNYLIGNVSNNITYSNKVFTINFGNSDKFKTSPKYAISQPVNVKTQNWRYIFSMNYNIQNEEKIFNNNIASSIEYDVNNINKEKDKIRIGFLDKTGVITIFEDFQLKNITSNSIQFTQKIKNIQFDNILITKSFIQTLQNQLKEIQQMCICDCNYCSCDCNYCSCDCNYCSCNCNYCNCDCNYCYCDCNYCSCDCNNEYGNVWSKYINFKLQGSIKTNEQFVDKSWNSSIAKEPITYSHDYCACDCNYCACDCNYCACDCNNKWKNSWYGRL